MADEKKASFSVELKDDTSPAAKTAADSLQQLKEKLEADTRALRGMQSALAKMKAGGLDASNAAKILRDRIESQKKAIAQAQAGFVHLGGSFEAVTKAVEEQKAPVEDIADRFGSANVEASAAAQAFDKVFKAAGGMKGILLASIGVVVALTAAITQAIVAVARYAITVSDARRSEALALEGMLRWQRVLGRTTTSAGELQSAIDQVADSTALGRDRISAFAQQIARAGVRGQALNDILEVTAITASAAGDEAANTFRSQATWAARAGASIKGLAGIWRARFGDIAQRQALGLDRQLERLRQNIDRLFDGFDTGPLLSAMNRVLSLFSQTTQTGRSIRRMITDLGRVFSHDLVGDSRTGGNALRDVFRDIVIATQRVVISILQTRRTILRMFPAIQRVGGVVGGMIIVWQLWRAAITGVGQSVLAVRNAFSEFGAGAQKLWARFMAIDWSHIGTAIVQGITNGLRSAWAGLTGTLTDLTHQLPETVRNILGIHSPSRVFANLGLQIPRGVAQGIERGAPEATAAAADVVTPPDPAPVSAPRAGRGASVVHVAPVFHVRIEGGNATEIVDELKSRVREILGETFEGLAIQIGAERPQGAT